MIGRLTKRVLKARTSIRGSAAIELLFRGQKQQNVATEQATEILLQGSKRVLFQAKPDTLLVQLPQNPAALHVRDPEQG
jgi:hypothetical protein